MKAPEADQRRLLDLNAVDTTIMQLSHRRKHLPEHAEVLRIQGELATIDDELTVAETALADLELEQRRAESELAPVRQRRERNQERIDGGAEEAKTLRGLIDEVASLDRRISDLEDAELDIMERLEAATAARDQVAIRHQDLDAALQAAVARRTEVAQQIDGVAKGKLAQRQVLVGAVPKPLFEMYEKIRRHTGSGAAALVARRCEGCGLQLNASDLNTFAHAAVDEVLRCPECGRILVRTKESGI